MLRLLLAIFLSVGLISPISARTVYDVYGSKGASQVTDECEAGWALIGVNANTGSWIDKITVVCGQLQPNGSIGATKPLTPRGGNGGGPSPRLCGPNEVVIDLQASRNKQFQIVHIDMTCKNLMTGTTEPIGLGAGTFFYTGPLEACRSGEVATGMNINFGTDVNGVGLICNNFIPTSAPPANPSCPTTPAPVCPAPNLVPVDVIANSDIYRQPGGKDADKLDGFLKKGTANVFIMGVQLPWYQLTSPMGQVWVYNKQGDVVQLRLK